MDDAERLRVQLSALSKSPQGHIDDTRYEKLLDRLTPYVQEYSKIQLFIENGGLEAIQKGLSVDDARVISVAIRLIGILTSHLIQSGEHPLKEHHTTIIKLMEQLLLPTHIDTNADALVRNACLTGLTTSTKSEIALDWMTTKEKCSRLLSFIFHSFSDSSIFIARSATQLLSELIIKGPEVERKLMNSGLQRHVDISMSEVPQPGTNSMQTPPPLHHNKICLIDLCIAMHRRAYTQGQSPSINISLASLIGLLLDPDRHVRSRMVEAIQIIGVNENKQSTPQPSPNEKLIYDVASKLMGSGEGDFILTAIDLVGVLDVGIAEEPMRKFFELVMSVVVPVFGKVVSIHADDVAKISPVKVDLSQSVLLHSVLECFNNLVLKGYTNVLPSSLVVDLVVYGLSGGDSHKLVYVRECHPAYELAASLLSRAHLLSDWITPHHVQCLLQALLTGLSRSWSSFSVKTVVSLLQNGKMEDKIFRDFGSQLKESVTKGFGSEESEPREHVVTFIGTLFKEDVSNTALEYYLSSGFHNMSISALNDPDSAVRTAALDSLQFICAEPKAWQDFVEYDPLILPSLIAGFVPPVTPVTPITNSHTKFLHTIVQLLYDEDPYVQRSSIGLVASWATHEHTKTALLLLIWDTSSGLSEGIEHALHRSDWDAQVQSIQLLRAIGLSLGMLSFLAVRGNSLVLDMIKNCEERVSQKEACSTLLALQAQMEKYSEHVLLLSPLTPTSPSTPFSAVGNVQYFQEQLQSFRAHIPELNLEALLKGLSDEHLYDEDEEEDLVLRYQDIQTNDDMDCD